MTSVDDEAREHDVVERADAEHLERSLREPAADAERADLAELARAARVEADGARALDLIADAGADVGAAVRDLARPAREVVVAGGEAPRELAVAARGPEAAVRRALGAVAADDAALTFAGLLGDDVDDAVEGVGAVERRAGAAHDLDALDVLDADRERLPDRGAEEVDVDAAAVDEDEGLVREALVEAADAHLGLAAGDLHDVDAGEAPQELGDLRDAREADVLLGDDRRRVRRVERALRALRRGDDALCEDVFGARRAESPRGFGRARRRRRRRRGGVAGVGAAGASGVGASARASGACAASRAACCCRLMRASRFLTICAASSLSGGLPSRYLR